MKKCASCSKDLPDAALHCVFCGAKQPPAPATTGGMAKTVMGAYSASDMMEHLRGQQPGGPAPRPGPGPGPGPSPAYGAPASGPPHGAPGPGPGYGAPGPGPGPGPAQSPYQRPAGPPSPSPHAAMPTLAAQPMHPAHGPTHVGGPAGAPYPSPGVPAAPSGAATMFVPGGPGAAPGNFGGGPAARPMPMGQPQPYGQPAGAYNVGPGPGHGPGPIHGHGGPGGHGPAPMQQPMPYAPMQPVAPLPQPSGMPPYLGAQAAARGGRPIEPWKDSLRLQMFVWGGALLVLFATPLSIDPLAFSWDTIIEAAGKAKLPPLILAAVGLLSIVLALIPTSPAPRGLIAGVLGLAGIAAPLVLAEVTAWQVLVPVAGLLLLIPGLLIREEYRESMLARILVTLGAIAVLLPLLLPENDRLPLVELFKQAIDAPGKAKVLPLLELARIVIVVLALLAWLPSPASGGAKVFAWILLLWPAVVLLTTLVLTEAIGDAVTKAPASVLAWIAATAYGVLVGYGFATVIGKKLE